MALTTWDGHARVDYALAERTLVVVLSTAEPTIEADMNQRLRAGFVTDDDDGPPAFLAAVLTTGALPDDLREMLGPRLSEAADNVLRGPSRGSWTRLDLDEVSRLATVWAPYRAWVLAQATQPAPARSLVAAVGAWADGLWTRLRVDDLKAALGGLALAPIRSEFDDPFGDPSDNPHGDGADDRAAPARGSWTLPADLAGAAGIEPRLEWETDGGGVRLMARSTGTGTANVLVAFDEVGQPWRPLRPGPGGVLSATIVTLHIAADLPAVRLQVQRRPA